MKRRSLCRNAKRAFWIVRMLAFIGAARDQPLWISVDQFVLLHRHTTTPAGSIKSKSTFSTVQKKAIAPTTSCPSTTFSNASLISNAIHKEVPVRFSGSSPARV